MNIRTKLRDRTRKTLRRVEAFATNNQRSYTAIVTAFAVTGLLLILFFPLMFIVGFEKLVTLITAHTPIDWLQLSTWNLVTLFSGFVCYRYIKFRPQQPAGITIPADKIPAFKQLLQKMKEHYKRPGIQHIIITPDYELDIVKTPRWAFPLWSDNNLVVGLPNLLCLSPEQFDCMVARKAGQFSKKSNPLMNWLYQLRSQFSLYASVYSQQKSLDSRLLGLLFLFYSKVYSIVSAYIVRQDEINADNYAMELYHHEIVREAITADMMYCSFMQINFWPAMKKCISNGKNGTRFSPMLQLNKALCNHMNGEKMRRLVERVFNDRPAWNSPAPSLAIRLSHIAHDTPRLSERQAESAAEKYLGSLLKTTSRIIDKQWLSAQAATVTVEDSTESEIQHST